MFLLKKKNVYFRFNSEYIIWGETLIFEIQRIFKVNTLNLYLEDSLCILIACNKQKYEGSFLHR